MRIIDSITVGAKFAVEGFHFWPESPERLAYLRNSHRHMFHVEVIVEVTRTNREVEIITLRQEAMSCFIRMGKTMPNSFARDYGSASCEMLAQELGMLLLEEDLAVSMVSVLEDDENGGCVYFREQA